MVVLITCKNEEDPIKNEGARVAIRYVDFSGAQGQITLKSVVGFGRNSNAFKFLCMCLLSARMKKIQSKINSLEWPQHFSHYKSMGIFQFVQGQLTPQPLVQFAPNSNSVQTLWLSLIPEKMKKIRSKMKALEWPQSFLYYNPKGAILLPWKPEFQSYLIQNLMKSIHHPNDASDQIWLNSACWLQRYSCLKV